MFLNHKGVLVCIFAASLGWGQVQTFSGLGGFNGPTGLGHSTYFCVDRDGDGYGVGPLAVINTTIAATTAAGTQTVTPASMTTSIIGAVTTSGSPVITLGTSVYTIQAGETITGSGIPANTTILSVSTDASTGLTATMSANATASATVTVNVGIGVGTVLRVDTSTNMERVVVTSVASNTFTATFAIAHAAGIKISDQGCFGPDADDLDATVVTASDIANKYESGSANTTVPHFRAKLANDILLANPGGVSADTAAQVATLRSPTTIYWLAPATATPAGSDSNSCVTAATPCLTISGLTTSGARGGTNYTSSSTGVLVFFRQGWDAGQITIFSGTSSNYTIYMSYPGEQATPSGTHFINIPDTHYIRLDGFKLTGGAYINAGTVTPCCPQTSITWHDNLYTHIDATGPFNTLGGLNGFGQTNNVFEDSAYHDNSATGSQHGIYIGSRNLQSTNILLQRLLLYRNQWNGLHFNGMCSGCTVQNSIAHSNGISGLDFEQGWNNSTVQSNLVFDNAKQITFFDYESGQCPGRTLPTNFTGTTANGSNVITGITTSATGKMQVNDALSGPGIPASTTITVVSSTSITISNNATASATVSTLVDHQSYFTGTVQICPHDENFNLIQNNTIYASGADNYPSFNTPQTGCSAIFANCAQYASFMRNVTQVDPLNPGGAQVQAGNFDHNTYRNNVIISNGKNNTHAPIDFSQNDGTNGEMCDSTCQNWMSTATLDHDVFWQSDGNNGNIVLSRASGTNTYTCATAGTVTTLTTCVDGNPSFADVVQASYYNNKSRYDFRLLTGSNALHSGSVTGVPAYDLAGRAFTEGTTGSGPSIGGLERNPWQQGWNTLSGAGLSSSSIDPTTGLSVVPLNGSPRDTLSAAITTTSATSFTVTSGANFFVGNLALIDTELVCISAVSGTTITTGSVASCSGTTSANGRGWAGTTAATHSNAAVIYLNTINGGGVQQSTAANVYPFQTQYPQYNTAGVGADGVARDIPGQPKFMAFGGGGHSNYIGNEIYAIYPNRITPFISRVSNNSVFSVPGLDNVGTWAFSATNSPVGATGGATQLKDGAWNTAHIQSNFAYDPSRDKFCKFGGSYAGGNGAHSYDTQCFNFATSLWERFSGSTHDVDCTAHGTGFSTCAFAVGRQTDPIGTFNGGGFSGLATFDPVTQTYFELFAATGNNSVLTQYYPDQHQHVVRASSQPFIQCCGTTTQGSNRVLDTSRRNIILQGLNGATIQLYKVDISGVTSTTPTSSPNPSLSAVTPDASCNGLLQTPGPGLVYIAAIDRVLGYPANVTTDTFYLMDPGAFTCTAVSSFTGGPTTHVNPYIDGQMQYFASLDATLLMNDVGTNAPRILSLSAPDPSATVCSISPTSVGPWTVGQIVSQPFTNSGCSGTWSSSGTWPPGITFNTSTGVASGTVGGSAGTFTPSVSYSTATNNLTIIVNAALVVTTSSPLPTAIVGTPYLTTISATGGTAPLSWSISSGSIPSSFTLSAGGSLSGTATTTTGSPFSFTATVTDVNNVATSKAFSLTVNPGITITSPTANQVISGFTSFSFTATLTASFPAAYCMAWQVDAYLPVGSSCVKAPYTLFHNTFMELNGTHTVTATLKDALGNTLATATQTFSIANTWPIAAGIGMTVATGTPLTSPWSGTVSITPTITGPDATHSKDTTWFVDGNLIFTDPLDTATSPTLSIDTTQFTNGQHVVAVVVKDNFGGISYGSDNFYVGAALEWSQPVTFSNGSATMELRTNMREVFLPPSGTFQLTATLYGTDGSTLSTPTPVYFSLNPSAVTVTSGGLLTGLTPVANTPSMARIGVMSPTISGTDLVCQNQTNCNSGYKSASHLMTQQNVGQMIVIPSGAGTWVAGNYYIQTVQNNGSGAFFLMSCTNSVCTNANPGANNSVATSFTTGPTETVYAMVTTAAPNPPIYHFDCTNGAILSTYTAGHSCYWISGFQTTQGFPYTATGTPGLDQTYSPGFVTDYANGGFTSVEASPSLQPSASTTESAYSGGGGTLATAVANYQAAVSGTNLHFTLIGDNWLKNSGPAAWGNGGLSQTTRAIYSPAWTTTPWTHVLNAWNGQAFTVEGGDEYSNFGPNPFEGPVTFTNGVTSITATGGGGPTESCSVAGNFSLSTLRHFVISGSTITNMNSATGTFYTASTQSPTFTFNCANVADGVYSSTNPNGDGLSIEPYVSSWFNNLTGLSTSANDYLRYDMFTNIRSQFTAASAGRANLTFSQIGTAGCSYIYGFTNPAAGLADYSTHLYTGFNQGYIMARNQVRGVVGTNGDLPVAPANGIMNPARLGFGCYSASAPLINQNSTVTNDYGLQGYTPNGTGTATGPGQDGTNSSVTNVTSFSGNTLALNTDHLIRQIYPGITRIQLSNMSNSADNGNYYIIGWPDTTHLTLANATTDFLANTTTLTATMLIGDTTFTVASAAMFDTAPYISYIGGELISCTTLTTNTFSVCTRGVSGGTGAAQHNSGTAVQIGGGTIHFQNGDTKSLYNIAATQTNTCGNAGQGPGNVCGDTFAYTGSTDQNILRHRGMTFTISGTSNSNFNTRNFYYNAENSGPVTAVFGNHYRELPNGSSTSGTATIIAAQDYVPGRQGGTPYFFDPDVAFAGQIAGFYERGAGTRVYTVAFNQNGYAGNGGILNGGFPQQPSYFNYVCIDPGCVSTPGTGIQGYSHPHWRSLYQAENFHAVALANLLHQRLASYWLTTSLNSPDMGNNFECTARSGSKGKSVGCMNVTNAPQTISFVTTPYLQSGQNFGQFIANSQAILLSTVASGTTSVSASVPAGGEVVWVFPATFANEFSQPTISVQPSDVTNAASVAVEYGYDQFLLDIGASTVSCGTGPSCTLPVDRNIGPVYYRLIYLNSSNAVISIGDVQIL